MDVRIRQAAWRQADVASTSCGVELRHLAGADLRMAQEVIGQTWGLQQIPQDNLLRALSHAGNVVLAAIDGGAAAGIALGFLGWNQGLHLHSHMVAVRPAYQSKGIGFALKCWQRAVCLDNGITEMRWTYDPLVRRNAYFNLVKLNARVRSFSPDFYGAMEDDVNSGDASDRFEVSWKLDAEWSAAGGVRDRYADAAAADRHVTLVEDFELLRRTDPDLAQSVRFATRARFTQLFTAGLRPEWDGDGYAFVVADPATSLSPARRS